MKNFDKIVAFKRIMDDKLREIEAYNTSRDYIKDSLESDRTQFGNYTYDRKTEFGKAILDNISYDFEK